MYVDSVENVNSFSCIAVVINRDSYTKEENLYILNKERPFADIGLLQAGFVILSVKFIHQIKCHTLVDKCARYGRVQHFSSSLT